MKKEKWFMLNTNGDIEFLGEAEDFDAADEIASDNKRQHNGIWLVGEEDFRRWHQQINQLAADHLPPIIPE